MKPSYKETKRNSANKRAGECQEEWNHHISRIGSEVINSQNIKEAQKDLANTDSLPLPHHSQCIKTASLIKMEKLK
jgi:hypothetical protein